MLSLDEKLNRGMTEIGGLPVQHRSMSNWARYCAIALCVVGMAACKTKPKDGEGAGAGGDAGLQSPAIENSAMNFDAQGSDSGKISGLQTIHFDYDKSNLTSEARQRAQGNADWMKSNPGTSVQIEGHCDARGSIEYNLALGERRAQAVKSYLVSLGVEGKRLSIISYGKEKPLAMGESEADYAKNRRANFVPLSK